MNNNISNRQLNISSAGQIALNLDKKDGQDGIISQSVWEEFWKTNDSENKYKGRKEANVGQNGISVRDAMKLIMTRIFNAANSLGEEVNKIGDKWLNGIENKEKIDANTVEQLNTPKAESAQKPTNNDFQEKIQQAKQIVLDHLSDIDLPDDMEKSKLQSALSKVQTKPLELPARNNLSVGDIVNSLILELLKEAYSDQKDIVCLKELAIKNTIKFAPNETIANIKSSDYNEQFIGELARIDEVTPSENFKKNVDKVVNILKEQLKNLSADELKTLGITPEKRDRLLGYINNIMYDNTGESAHATGPWIVMSTRWNEPDNISSMVALLMHEANHCDEEYYRYGNKTDDPNHNNYLNTWEEERACETLGMLTAGLLAKKGIIPDYSRYPQNTQNQHSVKSYIDENGNPTQLLKDDIEQWVQGYTNYPKDMNGNLTVRHMEENDPDKIVKLSDEERRQSLEIHQGDIIKIGDKEYPIGRDGYLLSPIDSAPIFQIVNKNGLVLSRLVFDAVLPNQTELDLVAKRHNKEDDKNLTEGSYTEIELICKDGTKYTGKCYDTQLR